MVGDRKLTSDGGVAFDPQTKIASCTFVGAKCLLAFTGLAKKGTFRTDQFVLQALMEAAKPSFGIAPALDGLNDRLTTRFLTLNTSKPEHKGFSAFFFGYDYTESPPRLRASLVSNFERWNERLPKVADEFETRHSAESRPSRSSLEPAVLLLVGAGGSVS
jgi:hypothetical protein